MSSLNHLYARLPEPAQHGAASVYGLYRYWLRKGPGYGVAVTAFRERDRLTPEMWANYQRQKLRTLLMAAAETVPYYCKVWGDVERKAIREGELTALPLLEKAPIREAPGQFVRGDRRHGMTQTFLTSGSTGTPISTIWSVQEIRLAHAIREVRSAGWAGVSFRLPRATFSGRMVTAGDDGSRAPYRYNVVERQVYFSAYHLSPATAAQYVHALNRHGTVWLTGYAVSFYLLASYMLEQGLKPPPTLRAVVTTSEKVTPEMRRVMEQAYRCRVFEEYSTVENALFVSECEHGRLHSSPDAAVVEILRPDGSPCTPGEIGEVVTTNLLRTYQPFIRYRLGDLAAWDPEPCPCGRGMPVMKEVVGRLEDVLQGPDGRRLVRFHGVFVDQPHVREGQVIQETLECIRVKVVPTSGFTEVDREDIVARVKARIGEVHVIVELVDAIPRTKRGKFKPVVSLLNSSTEPEVLRA